MIKTNTFFNKIKDLSVFDSFKIVWVLMIFVVIYYTLVAADRYVSTITMSVKSTTGSTQASGVLSLLTATSNTNEDIKFLQGYIESLDMLKILDEKIHLKQLYDEQYIDLFYSLSSSSSIESYLKYYQSRVKVHVDDKTGLLNVEVEGFTPESAHLIAKTIMQESEKFINDDLIFTTGLRYIYSDLFDSEVTPRVYLVYHLNDNVAFKGGVAMGYKTPAAKQLTNGYYNYSNNGASFGNPDLKPEESTNYELGVDFRIFDFAHYSITGFITDFKNQISSEELSTMVLIVPMVLHVNVLSILVKHKLGV